MLTESQKRDYPEYLHQIAAVLKLAQANFPRTTEVTIETSGSSPKAALNIPWYVLDFMVTAGLTALKEGER